MRGLILLQSMFKNSKITPHPFAFLSSQWFKILETFFTFTTVRTNFQAISLLLGSHHSPHKESIVLKQKSMRLSMLRAVTYHFILNMLIWLNQVLALLIRWWQLSLSLPSRDFIFWVFWTQFLPHFHKRKLKTLPGQLPAAETALIRSGIS